MSAIKRLSESSINRIAAGEVVERPSSVVKELVENAIDAGASKIEIIIEQAGKNLISIKDNGKGMSASDLTVAVERHTTSKLDEDDIMCITSFGFRGEALPSIASVSRMTITSRTAVDDLASKISANGTEFSVPEAASREVGTTIEVRDLFFATPARLKFLRSDRRESHDCVDIVKRLALSHPHISFEMVNDGKKVLVLKAKSESSKLQAIRLRAEDIFGKEFLDNAVELDVERDGIALSGVIGLPTYNKASAENQLVYVNNRPVKDKVLATAVRVAYQDYLVSGRHAVLAIFIEVGPRFVDVNVHPAKSEVRFRDSNLVRSCLIGAIRDAIIGAGSRVSTTPAAQAIRSFKPSNIAMSRVGGQGVAQSHFASPEQADYRPASSMALNVGEGGSFASPTAKMQDINEDTNKQLQEQHPMGAAVAQVHKTYVIAQAKDSLIIVDQHAAHERLTYEKLKKQVASSAVMTQRLLIPEIIELQDEQRADAVISYRSKLEQMGLVLNKFGDKSIVVTELPSLLGEVDVQGMIKDLAENMLEFEEDVTLSKLIEHVLETYSCHHSIRAGRVLSATEMNVLLREIESTPTSGQCNHGRPTYIELKLGDIERLFGRK